MKAHIVKKTGYLAMALILSAVSISSKAESVWIGGGSGAGNTRVAYLGRIAPLPGKRLSDGWSYSVFASYVGYHYDSGAQDIKGTVKGAKIGIGREFRRDHGSISLSLGGALNHTTLSPDDPGNSSRGSSVHPVGEFLWQSKADADWRSSTYAQYTLGARSNFLNAFLGKRLSNGSALGPQISTGGDPNYRIYGVALALNGLKIGPMDMGVYAGTQHSEGGDSHKEIGFSFVVYQPD